MAFFSNPLDSKANNLLSELDLTDLPPEELSVAKEALKLQAAWTTVNSLELRGKELEKNYYLNVQIAQNWIMIHQLNNIQKLLEK